VNGTALDRLIAGEEALLAALDGEDVAAIEVATLRFRDALEAIRSSDPVERTPAVKARLVRALELADQARARTNYLADRTSRQLDRLAAVGVGRPVIAYGRDGRLR
jgi:hypothetical protein